jgi:hypothetical protein
MNEWREVGKPGQPAEPVAGVPMRGRGAVAASILGALLIGAFFAAAPGGLRTPTGTFLLNAVIVAVAFWIPAQRIGAVADVAEQWKGLLAWALAWTVVWDVANSGVILTDQPRALFQDGWLVYPVGVLTLGILLVLQGAVVGWTGRRRGPAPSGPDVRPRS